MIGFLRAIAVLMGLVFVTGGGGCVLIGVPVFFKDFSSNGGYTLPIGIATSIGAAVLIVGLLLLKFGFRQSKPASQDLPPAHQTNNIDDADQ